MPHCCCSSAGQPGTDLSPKQWVPPAGRQVGSRRTGEEGLLGASRKVGEKCGVGRMCSLTAVVSLLVLFMHTPEKPMDILTFIVGTQAEALVPLSLSDPRTSSPCPLPAMFPSSQSEPVGCPHATSVIQLLEGKDS